jgi:hypothetical protein
MLRERRLPSMIAPLESTPVRIGRSPRAAISRFHEREAGVVSAAGEIALESFRDPQLAPGDALVRIERSASAAPASTSSAASSTAGGDVPGRGRRPPLVLPPRADAVVRERRLLRVTLGCEREPHLFGGWAEQLVLRSDAFVYRFPNGRAPELAVLVEPLVVTAVLDEARGHSYLCGESFPAGDTVVVQVASSWPSASGRRTPSRSRARPPRSASSASASSPRVAAPTWRSTAPACRPRWSSGSRWPAVRSPRR